MKRSKLALLCAVLLCLVSGSAPPEPTGSHTVEVDLAPADGYGVENIVAVLRELNPRLTERDLRRIAVAILDSSDKYGIDPMLVTAVIWEESHGRPWVRSSKGAIGLMQVMPHMSALVETAGNLTTIESNIELGCLILSDNIRRLGVEDGISAYFWGSRIRGVSYLHRVLEKRASVQRLAAS